RPPPAQTSRPGLGARWASQASVWLGAVSFGHLLGHAAVFFARRRFARGGRRGGAFGFLLAFERFGFRGLFLLFRLFFGRLYALLCFRLCGCNALAHLRQRFGLGLLGLVFGFFFSFLGFYLREQFLVPGQFSSFFLLVRSFFFRHFLALPATSTGVRFARTRAAAQRPGAQQQGHARPQHSQSGTHLSARYRVYAGRLRPNKRRPAARPRPQADFEPACRGGGPRWKGPLLLVYAGGFRRWRIAIRSTTPWLFVPHVAVPTDSQTCVGTKSRLLSHSHGAPPRATTGRSCDSVRLNAARGQRLVGDR